MSRTKLVANLFPSRIFKTALEIKVIRYWFNGLFVFTLSVNLAFAENKTRIDTTRGAMLYDNHCLQCHTQDVHWREKRIATDWKSLIAQVDRWQRASGLEWNKDDIREVSHYLNAKFYHYP